MNTTELTPPPADAFPVGTLVTFREGTPQYTANADIVYRVVAAPGGGSYSIDRTHGDDRLYVWLEAADDSARPPSRRRRRTGYVSALESAEAPTQI